MAEDFQDAVCEPVKSIYIIEENCFSWEIIFKQTIYSGTYL